ncbi:MAG: imidazolonepropionase [Blastococcus sp.]|nr:imidazolonepropionase [Blastococcus sp.]
MVDGRVADLGTHARETVDMLVVDAAELVTCRTTPGGARGADLDRLEVIPLGAVAIHGGRIVAVGDTATITAAYRSETVVSAAGRLVSPGLVDPHTHLVHAGSRHLEWEDLVGNRPRSIDDGIRTTFQHTAAASADVLRTRAMADLDVALHHGTTTLETKSGYGANRQVELRLLEVADSLRAHPVDVISTFFGAQVLPAEFRGRSGEFIDSVIAMLPEVAPLTEYCDVCLDPIGFSLEECTRLALAARAAGLGVRVHGDQTGHAGGAGFAADIGAASVDHLDYASEADLRKLARSSCVAVLVPGVTHHLLELVPAADGAVPAVAPKGHFPSLVAKMVELGVCIAVSTDYNPGTSPTLSMQTAMQLAARLFRLSYSQVWHMATINAAKSLGRDHDRGSLEPGKIADLVIWQVPEHGMVLNRFGTNLVDRVIKAGEVVACNPVGSAAWG